MLVAFACREGLPHTASSEPLMPNGIFRGLARYLLLGSEPKSHCQVLDVTNSVLVSFNCHIQIGYLVPISNTKKKEMTV